MKASKMLVAMVCCAMSGVAMAQHETPKMPDKKDIVKMAQPAGDKKEGEKKDQPAMSEMERAMMEAGTPGKMHEWMAKGVGTWDATIKMMTPGQPVSESKGQMTTEMVFGGRFAKSFFKGDFMGMPFEGSATMGYNNTTGKFESTWADNFSTGMTYMTGTVDKDGKVLTMTGECVDPMTKKACKMRQVSTLKGDNEMFEEFYKTVDGKEMKEMEITYLRAKGAAQEKGAMDKMKNEGDKLKKKVEDEAKKHMPGGEKK